MTAQPLHVRGVVLPDREHHDIWVRDGRITFDSVPNADTVAVGWVLPGLVDLHCHVGLDSRGAVPREDAERLVVDGFFDPVLQRIPFEGVRQRLKKSIEAKMGG